MFFSFSFLIILHFDTYEVYQESSNLGNFYKLIFTNFTYGWIQNKIWRSWNVITLVFKIKVICILFFEFHEKNRTKYETLLRKKDVIIVCQIRKRIWCAWVQLVEGQLYNRAWQNLHPFARTPRRISGVFISEIG